MRRFNPIIIINGIFLIAMFFLFAHFVNTRNLFTQPSALEVLAHDLTGRFIHADGEQALTVTEIKREALESMSIWLKFEFKPSLPAPWGPGWQFKISRFGRSEWLAEWYSLTDPTKINGCEVVFHRSRNGFKGMTVNDQCHLGSTEIYYTLRLRTAPDSLIFASLETVVTDSDEFLNKLIFLHEADSDDK